MEKEQTNIPRRIESVIDVACVGIWEWNVQTGKVNLNKVCARIFGYTVEELDKLIVGQLNSLIHPDDLRYIKELQNWRLPSESANYEMRVKHKLGHWIWILVRGRIVDLTSDSKPRLMVGALTDITESKLARTALHQSEEQHLTILQTTMDGFWLVDQQGCLLEVNEAYSRMSGYSTAELLTMRISDLEAAETIENTTAHIQSIVARGEDRFESRHRRKNGSVFDVEVSVKALATKSDRLVVFLRDISAHKQAEEDLKFKNLLLTTQQECSIDGILVVDRAGKILSFNSRFAEIWEIPAEILVTNSDELALGAVRDRLVYPEEFFKKVEFLYANPEVTSRDEIILKDGRVLDRYSAPLIGADRKYFGRVWYFQDITERRLMEKALIESERLSAVGELSAGVAHDFNNTLQAIFGNIELAITVPYVPEEVREYLVSIKEVAQDAAARVRRLQHFAQQRSKKEYEMIQVLALLDEAILQTRPMWKNEAEIKGVSISIQKNYGEKAYVDGDAGELSSAFHNIIKNAIEAMPNGGTITVAAGMIENEAFVRISDTGIGMDEETKKRIFQPFFSTKGVESGRGLGMSSVYAIIQDHGGTVTVKETAVGQGTTIEILLPLGRLYVGAKDREENAYLIPARVLLVDDERMIRVSMKRQIERLGHYIDVAAGGEEALALLSANRYDLMITDVGMPGMSGWQLAEVVKGKYVNMKVAVLTGWGATVTNEQKTAHGVGYVLSKPAGIEEIKNLIGEVLQSKI